MLTGMDSPRPSVRVVCVDPDQRILLLRWRDRVSGDHVWEPPGGGIKPGEEPLDAARRELWEETGLAHVPIDERFTLVWREVRWNGVDFAGEEAFFLCRLTSAQGVHHRGFEPHEVEEFREHRWVPWHALDALEDPVEPPQLLQVLAELAPGGPWSANPA